MVNNINQLLQICGMEYYLNSLDTVIKNNARRNALISPAVTPREVLKKFPPTYIGVGSLDPLLDDAVYMAKRIEQTNGTRSIKLEVFDSLGHGYLNLINVVPEAKLASSRICEWINEIVKDI